MVFGLISFIHNSVRQICLY